MTDTTPLRRTAQAAPRAAKQLLRLGARLYQRIGAQVVLLLALLGLVYFHAYFLLNSSYTRRLFDETVNTQFRGRIGWSRLTWGPWPWQIRILEPVLADPEGRPVITADAVQVESVDLLGLLSLRIAARGITVEHPIVRLASAPDPEAFDEFGRPREAMNIERLFWPPEWSPDDGSPPPPISLDFSEVALTDARFELRLPDVFLVARGIEVKGAHFSLSPANLDTMTIGAELTEASRVTLQIRTDPFAPRAHLAGPEARLDFEAKAVRCRGFAWKGMAFGVSEVELRAHGDPVEVKAFRLDLSGPGLPVMGGQVDARLADLGPHLQPFGLADVSGRAQVRLHGRGPVDAFAGDFEVGLKDVAGFGLEVDSLTLRGAKEEQNIFNIEHLNLEALGGEVQTAGRVDLVHERAFLTGEVQALDPTRLPVALPPKVASLVGGQISGPITLRAVDFLKPERQVSLETALTLKRRGLPFLGLGRQAQLEALATLKGTDLKLHRLTAWTDLDRVQITGGLALAEPALSLQGEVEVGELGRWTSGLGLPLSGQLKASLSARGPLGAPTLGARFQANRLGFQSFSNASAEGELSYRDGVLAVKQGSVSARAGKLKASGKLHLDRQRIELAASLSDVDLAALPSGQPIAGKLSGTVQANGALRRPQLRAKLVVDRPSWQGVAFTRLEATGQVAGSAVSLQTLKLDLDGRRLLEASGELNLRRETFKALISLEKLPLALLNRFLKEPLPIAGQVGLSLEGRGTFQDPTGTGSLTLSGLRFQNLELGDGELTVSAEGQSLNIRGRLFDAFDLQAGLPTKPDGRLAEASVSFESLALHERLPMLKPLALTLSGRVSARADAFAGRLDEVKVSLSQVAAGFDPVNANSHGSIDLSFRHGVLNLDSVLLDLASTANQPYGTLQATGTVSQDLNADIDLALSLELSTLEPFLTTLFTRMRGRVELKLTLSGDLTNPTPTGRVRLVSADLSPRSSTLGRELHLVEPVVLDIVPPFGPMPMAEGELAVGIFQISMPRLADQRPNRLIVRRDDGVLEINHLFAYFEGFKPTSLVVEGDGSELSLLVPGALRATVDVEDLRFALWDQATRRASETRMKLSGLVNIQRGVYSANMLSTTELNQGVRDNLTGRTQRQTVSVFETTPLLKRLMLDLKLKGENDFFIRNQVTMLDLNLEIRTDLRVKGFVYPMPTDDADEQLALEGLIEVLPDSTITYSRRPFEVLSGTVNFGGGDFLDAQVEASHTFRLRTDEGASSGTFDQSSGDVRLEEVTLSTRIRMPTRDSKPEIDLSLSSNSGASKIEVATLVLTGSYPSDLSGAAGAQPATEVLLGPLLGLLEQPLEETLNLDLTLTPAAGGTLFIEVDKLLSRRLRLYTRTPVGQEDTTNAQTFGLEYRLNNQAYGDLTNEQVGNLNSTSGRLRLRFLVD